MPSHTVIHGNFGIHFCMHVIDDKMFIDFLMTLLHAHSCLLDTKPIRSAHYYSFINRFIFVRENHQLIGPTQLCEMSGNQPTDVRETEQDKTANIECKDTAFVNTENVSCEYIGSHSRGENTFLKEKRNLADFAFQISERIKLE